MFKLVHNCTHLTSQQSNAQNFPSQASTVHELRTCRYSSWILKRQRNQRSNYQYPLDHWKSKSKSSRKTSISASLTMPKLLTVWIKTNGGKFFKTWEYQTHLTCFLKNLYAGQEATVKTGHETTDWFQIRKGVCQGCVLSPYLIYTERFFGGVPKSRRWWLQPQN